MSFDYENFDPSKAMERWSEEDRDDFEERAAIIEFDGGLSRPEAEYRAFWEVERARRARTSE